MIWDSAWNIGHQEIDEQHQRWFELLNSLKESVLSSDNKKLTEVKKATLREMLDYTRYHFKNEEKMMHENNYPRAHLHWRMHKDFENIVYENYRKVEEGGLVLTTELISLIKDWLLNHIQNEDKNFGLHLDSLKI